jgi:threonine dehydrogenase-like Zn-dependent dehydrogenase
VPALRLIESRKYPLELMHTATFGLPDVDKAVAALAGRSTGEHIHVMLSPHVSR